MSLARPLGLILEQEVQRVGPTRDSHTTAVKARPPPVRPSTIVLVIGGPIGRAEIQRLCSRLRASLQESDAGQVVCNVGALIYPDAVTIDALARLQLTARRCGRRVLFRNACGELLELVDLMGLSDVLPCRSVSGLESGGKAEEREQGLGVEEEADSSDPTA